MIIIQGSMQAEKWPNPVRFRLDAGSCVISNDARSPTAYVWIIKRGNAQSVQGAPHSSLMS
jgi:hypothetical protein